VILLLLSYRNTLKGFVLHGFRFTNIRREGAPPTKASAVIPAQAGIHKLLILIVDKVTGFRPAPEWRVYGTAAIRDVLRFTKLRREGAPPTTRPMHLFLTLLI